MQLDELYDLIEILKSRATEHKEVLQRNESLTRYSLIDPLIQALGWDTGNPAQVVPEYRSGHGRADYALLHEGKPVMMIEAKSLNSDLRDSTLQQGLMYTLAEGTPYFAVTNGIVWEIYDTYKQTNLEEKLLVRFDLSSIPPSEVALASLVLWRRNVQSSTLTIPSTPLVDYSQGVSITAQSQNLQGVTADVGPLINNPGGMSSTSKTPGGDGVNVPNDSLELGPIPSISKDELKKLDPGRVCYCPSRRQGIDFLVANRKWGFLKIAESRKPKYLAIYVSAPVKEIQYFAEVDQIIDPSPELIKGLKFLDGSESDRRGKKIVLFKEGRLWKLSSPIEYGKEQNGKAPGNTRFVPFDKFVNANTLDDLE